MSEPLPPARLIPKDGADHAAILRGQARDGARVAGRVAWGAGKALALIAICGAGLIAIGAGAGRSKSRELDELDRRMQSIQRMNDSIRRMPKIDYRRLYQPMFDRRIDLSRGGLVEQLEGGLLEHESPAQPSIRR